jgi:hypothetical protein
MFGVLCPNLAFFEPFLPKNTLPPLGAYSRKLSCKHFGRKVNKRRSLFAFLKVNNVHQLVFVPFSVGFLPDSLELF